MMRSSLESTQRRAAPRQMIIVFADSLRTQ
jgi:hypothetical protein